MLGRGWPTWATLLLTAGAVLVTTGVGFAAFTATATVNGTATPGSIGLVITSVTQVSGPSYVTIQTSPLPTTVATVWVNQTTGGSQVELDIVVKNIGTVPATNIVYTFSTTLSGPSSCSLGTYMYPAAANIPPGATLAPGASFPSYWQFVAGPNLSDCAGAAYFWFTISWTGTAGA